MAGFLRRPPLASPREGTRFALEGPNDRVRDPATVERARLRARPFIVDPTLVHERRVERASPEPALWQVCSTSCLVQRMESSV